jgi:hypothetical protein
MSDRQLKERWLKMLNAEPRSMVKNIVDAHLRNLPHLKIEMAIWLNAGADPWDKGVDLVEICGRLPGNPIGDLRPVEFAPHEGWPRLRVILTDAQDLTQDDKQSGAKSVATRIRKVLADRKKKDQAVVFHSAKGSPEDYFRNMLARA